MILDTIVAEKKREVEKLLVKGIVFPARPVAPPRGFAAALAGKSGVRVIAEAKKASPSKGIIRPDFDPAAIARSYAAGGAAAMSVLTDEVFFQGALSYLELVRTAVDLPVLRKEFIIHEVQIREAHAWGADAILLIAAILDVAQMRDFRQQAEECGMDVLVEVHDEPELEQALQAGSRLVGINNRNLQTFAVDLATTFRLAKEIPADIPVVSESGIRNRDDMLRLADAGIHVALIGETLMRAADPGKALQEILV